MYVTLPFGTANDLPRAFGWGKNPSWWLLNDMNFVMEELMEAEEMSFNVWEVCIETREDGGWVQVPDGWNLRDLEDWNQKILMCHSFSFGIDARIGLAFEWRWTRSRFWNQFMYGWEGIKRLICCCYCRTETVRDILSWFSVLKWRHIEEGEEIKNIESIEKSDEEEKVLFATSKEEARGTEPLLRGNP